MLLRIVEVIAFAGFAASVAYTVLATACLWRFRRALSSQLSALRKSGTPASREPGAESLSVTIAKPLCGDEAGLYENLRSFCEQDYPEYQVVFGVREKTDPAAAIARRLIEDFPGRDLRLVVGDGEGGTNKKVSNLAAMQPLMKHELIVVSDSDMRVRRDYLRVVTASFADPHTG